MATSTLETLESLATAAVTLVGQVARTFLHILLLPRRFARAFTDDPPDTNPYVQPYTFLGVAGFLGTKAILVTATSVIVTLGIYNHGEGTYQTPRPVLEQMIALPTLQELLITAIPIIVIIHIVGAVFSAVISRNHDVKVRQSLYYAAGIQYVLIAAFVFLRYELEWEYLSNWWPDHKDALSGPLNWLERLATVGLPALLIAMIADRAVKTGARRFGRVFLVLLPFMALGLSMTTAALPQAGTLVLLASDPPNLRLRSVLSVAFVGSPVVSDDSVALTVLVTNQETSQLFLSTSPASVVYSMGRFDARKWSGRLFDPDSHADVLILPAGATKALRFEGRGGDRMGLSDHAIGRLEVTRILDDGRIVEIEADAPKPDE